MTFSIYREILCKIEVEHDFFEGLSKRVTLKFSWQPANFMTFSTHKILDYLGEKGTRFW